MIEWLSSWAEQVIVAVIIGTIIEMILPNGNNKKYIKTVIGVYILFTIVSPIIGKIMGSDLSSLDFDYEKYFKDTDTYQTMSQSLEVDNTKNIQELYQTNLKNDMKSKLQEKGYLASNIKLETQLQDDQNYGKITKISMTVTKLKEEQEENLTTSNTVSINVIEKIQIGNVIENTVEQEDTKKEEKNTLKTSEINELKTYLSNVYEVNKKQIQINEKGG